MQDKLEEARTEVLRATDIFDKLGAAKDAERCMDLLWFIETDLNSASGQSGFELLQVVPLPACTDSPFQVQGSK